MFTHSMKLTIIATMARSLRGPLTLLNMHITTRQVTRHSISPNRLSRSLFTSTTCSGSISRLSIGLTQVSSTRYTSPACSKLDTISEMIRSFTITPKVGRQRLCLGLSSLLMM